MKKINYSSLIILLVILLSGCAGTKNELPFNPNKTDRHGGTLRLAMAGEVRTLDPARVGDDASHIISSQIYEGLVDFDQELKLVPALAESWKVSKDGLTWTFKLRDKVLFQDDPCFPNNQVRLVTARDVKYSFERICDPKSLSTGWWLFNNKIVGANEYREALSTDNTAVKRLPGVAGFIVVNDSTFVVKLTRPFAPFLNLMAMAYTYVVPKEAVKYYGEEFFKHPVGTGSFTLREWTPGKQIVLGRNTKYWETSTPNGTLPYLDYVKLTFLRDNLIGFLEFEKGKFDLTGIPPEVWHKVMGKDKKLKENYTKYRLTITPSLDTGYFGFLMGSEPLGTNVKLRQAMNYAIDREAIIKFMLNGRGQPAKGVLPPGIPGYSAGLTGYRYDLVKAKALMMQAGYPDGQGLPEIELQLNSGGTTNEDIAAIIQEQLAKIGIRIKLKLMAWPQHLDAIDRGMANFFRLGWVADYPDPENFIALFYGPNAAPLGPNSTRYSNLELDKLYDQALVEINQEKRLALYRKAEEIIVADAPWLFLTHGEGYRLEQPYIHGYASNAMGRVEWKRVWMGEQKE